jgi:hypothetical protein
MLPYVLFPHFYLPRDRVHEIPDAKSIHHFQIRHAVAFSTSRLEDLSADRSLAEIPDTNGRSRRTLSRDLGLSYMTLSRAEVTSSVSR